MYAQLGNIIFEGLNGFTSFEETYAVNYAQHERIKGKPRLEPVGDSLDTINFEMYLHADFIDPNEAIETLRAAMSDREILPLVLGSGRVVGNFVIPSLNKTTSFTDPDGNLIEATLSVELLECYNDEPLDQERQKKIDRAFATSDKSSNVRSALPPKLSEGLTVSDSVSDIQASGIQTTQYATAIEKNPATASYYSDKIDAAMDKMEEYITVINQKLTAIESLTGITTGIPAALSGLYSRIQDIKAVLPVSDIAGFKILNNNLQNSIKAVKTSAVGINNKSIIRRV